jgi:hypothetical protein
VLVQGQVKQRLRPFVAQWLHNASRRTALEEIQQEHPLGVRIELLEIQDALEYFLLAAIRYRWTTGDDDQRSPLASHLFDDHGDSLPYPAQYDHIGKVDEVSEDSYIVRYYRISVRLVVGSPKNVAIIYE